MKFLIVIISIITLTQSTHTECSKAIQLPLTFNHQETVHIDETDIQTLNYCENTEYSRHSYYVHLTSESNEITIDTCNSTSGFSSIEIIDNCDNAQCLMKSTSQCGYHSYLQYSSEKPLDIIVRFVCHETPCDLNIRYELPKQYKYDRCYNPLKVTESIHDVFNPSQQGESLHGCQSSIYSKGKWYKLEVNKKYTSISVDAFISSTKQRVPIEIKKGCDDYYCSTRYSQTYLDPYYIHYLYIYDDTEFTKEHTNETIEVDISYENKQIETECSIAKKITLPYSIHSSTFNQQTCKSQCNQKSVESQWFTFTTSKKSIITISTKSDIILSETFVSISSGSCDQLKCIKDISTNSVDKGVLCQFESQENMQYNIQIGALVENLTSEYILVIKDNEYLQHSKANDIEQIKDDGEYYYTISTEQSYKTVYNGMIGYGMFIVIESDKKKEITISTCSPITNKQSVVLPIKNQQFNEESESNTFEIIRSSEMKSYSNTQCGTNGKIAHFIHDSSDSTNFFVGISSNEIDDTIALSISIKSIPLENDDSSKLSPGKIVLIVIVSLLLTIGLVSLIVIIALYIMKKKNEKDGLKYDALASDSN